MLKIVVDAMGGDNAPAEIVKGAVLALKERKDFAVVLTGDENLIRAELEKLRYDASRVEIVHCSEVITNDDVPTSAVRSKRDSSLVVGLKLLKEREDVGGFVSAGSTGAVLTGGIMFVGRIKECKPAYLAQFGVMASAYAKAAFGVENPRVGLLTNGAEEHKGDPLHQEAHQLLKQTKGVNFVGNIEGRDIMYGDVDVAVSDGFSGNVALKSIEGCGKTVSAVLNREFRASLGSKLSYLCAKKQIGKLKYMLDYARFGGSVFLGLKKAVIKSHGSSKAKSITPSVIQAVDAYRGNLIGNISEALAGTAIEGTIDE